MPNHRTHDETAAPGPATEASAPGLGPDPLGPERTFSIEDMKRKIRGLLAKAEGTANDLEREAFNRKAEQLMVRLGVQRAELEAEGKVGADEIIQVHRDFGGNYAIVMIPFVNDLAYGFGSITVLQGLFPGTLRRRAFIIGHRTDVEAFTFLLDSCARQVMTALKQWQRDHIDERRGQTDMQKYLGHRSFITAFGATVRDRLKVRREAERAGASSGAELVLVSKDERIKDHIAEQYGQVEVARTGPRKHSLAGHIGGARAGARADLGEAHLSSPRLPLGGAVCDGSCGEAEPHGLHSEPLGGA